MLYIMLYYIYLYIDIRYRHTICICISYIKCLLLRDFQEIRKFSETVRADLLVTKNLLPNLDSKIPDYCYGKCVS